MTRIAFILLLGMMISNGIFAKTIFTEKLIHQKKMNVEIAITTEDLKQGLSDRKQLFENQAMLFVFPQEERLFFWMNRMHLDLDMIWLDKHCKIVDIFPNQKPCVEGEVCPITSSPNPAQYVLEVVSGFSQKNHLTVGERLEVCG